MMFNMEEENEFLDCVTLILYVDDSQAHEVCC